MRSLLLFILLVSWASSIVVLAESSNAPNAKQQASSKASNSDATSTAPKWHIKTSKKTSTSSLKKKQETKAKTKKVKATKKTIVGVDELKKIIDSLPEKDRKIISAIKKQISTWPKEVFDEISDYREFIISSRNIAQYKYSLLSPEAKSALETERHLKAKLSQDTVRTLETLKVNIN